ncbi:hypothetical protein GCM10022224_038970 [Nonomuraea antimicrobica]|uniref:Uncharacterized protein n=1 Tax=Nonomuraea antimicrobica TaxID=561173 RepID=A0ABP7BVL4_9ACTN
MPPGSDAAAACGDGTTKTARRKDRTAAATRIERLRERLYGLGRIFHGSP